MWHRDTKWAKTVESGTYRHAMQGYHKSLIGKKMQYLEAQHLLSEIKRDMYVLQNNAEEF